MKKQSIIPSVCGLILAAICLTGLLVCILTPDEFITGSILLFMAGSASLAIEY